MDENEPKLNGVYLRNNLTEIKHGMYVVDIHECMSIGTHCIVLYQNGNNVTYFDSFGVEHVSKETKNSVETKIL